MTTKILHWGIGILIASALIAAAIMTMHALPFTRQPDVQHIQYAFELLASAADGDILGYLSMPKKYPFLYVIIHAILYGIVFVALLLTGGIASLSKSDVLEYVFTQPIEIHFATRVFTIISAVALAFFLWKITKKLFPKTNPMLAIVLLLCSPMILTFMTAMRPHITQIALLMGTFWFSLKLYEEDSVFNLLWAFTYATAAFCILQNGLFAFIFPLYAIVFFQGERNIKRLFSRNVILIGGCAVVATLLLGYPFILKELIVDTKFGTGLGNEDIASSPRGIQGFWVVLKTMIGSELIPLLYTIGALWLAMKKKLSFHPFLASIIIYSILYILFFGSIGWAQARYFIVFIPICAVLGAPAMGRSPTLLQGVTILIGIALSVQFSMLGLKLDTYEEAALYLQTETTGTIATDIPYYHLGIQPAKEGIERPKMEREKWITELPENLEGARTFIDIEKAETADFVVANISTPTTKFFSASEQNNWSVCKEFKAANTNAIMFLWSEVDWPLYWIWQTRALGPNIRVYCKKDF